MTDYLFGAMVQPNTPISISGAIIADNVSVTGSSLPTNGLYLSAANTLSFATNSTQKMVMNSTGCVAIGNSTAFSLLDVFGSTTVRGSLAVQNLSGTNSSISLTSTDNSYTALNITNSQSQVALTSNGAQSELRTNTSTPLVFMINSTERMRIDSGGNVAIGTSAASAPGGSLNFTVQSSASDTLICCLLGLNQALKQKGSLFDRIQRDCTGSNRQGPCAVE